MCNISVLLVQFWCGVLKYWVNRLIMLTQVPDHNTIIIQQQEQHHDKQSQNDQKGHHKSLSGAKWLR